MSRASQETPTPQCIKRMTNEMKLIQKNNDSHIEIIMNEENILIWYFLIKGYKGSLYEGGYYIGQLTFSPRYPETGPQVKMLTPNGRFETNQTICLTNSHYHPESWTPAWNIGSFVKGIESIMCSDDCTGIAHIVPHKGDADVINYRRNMYAKDSVNFNNTYFPDIFRKFIRFVAPDGTIIPEKTPDTKIMEIAGAEAKEKKHD